jgi:hypothetical protein
MNSIMSITTGVKDSRTERKPIGNRQSKIRKLYLDSIFVDVMKIPVN